MRWVVAVFVFVAGCATSIPGLDGVGDCEWIANEPNHVAKECSSVLGAGVDRPVMACANGLLVSITVEHEPGSGNATAELFLDGESVWVADLDVRNGLPVDAADEDATAVGGGQGALVVQTSEDFVGRLRYEMACTA